MNHTPFLRLCIQKADIGSWNGIKTDDIGNPAKKRVGECMKKDDVCVLREIQRNTELAMKAVDCVMDKVYDDGLALQLSRQALHYSRLHDEAVDKLLAAHLEPARISAVEEYRVKGNLHMDTLLNTSTSHIAELAIQESSRKISKVYQALHKYEGVGTEALEIAKELISAEETNMIQLRKFL